MSFWTAIFGAPKNKSPTGKQVVVDAELADCATNYAARKYALEACAAMIARAVAAADYQTVVNGKKKKDLEWYLWNVEPNKNQNSSAFLQQFVRKAVTHGEAIAVEIGSKPGQLVVADSYAVEQFAAKPNRYTGVTVGTMQLKRTYQEQDVLRIVYSSDGAMAASAAVAEARAEMLAAAKRAYIRAHSVRLKVKVDQMAAGAEDFANKFAELMEKNVVPFAAKDNAVLPQFNGYEYTDFGAGNAPQPKDYDGIFDGIMRDTCRMLGIPPAIMLADVADLKDARTQWLTCCIDPLCCQLEEEINRKRYGADLVLSGTYLHIDTSTIVHHDLFGDAEKIEKLIGSGAYSVNDVVTASGGVPINDPWADEHWLTLNIANIAAAANAAKGGDAN